MVYHEGSELVSERGRDRRILERRACWARGDGGSLRCVPCLRDVDHGARRALGLSQRALQGGNGAEFEHAGRTGAGHWRERAPTGVPRPLRARRDPRVRRDGDGHGCVGPNVGAPRRDQDPAPRPRRQPPPRAVNRADVAGGSRARAALAPRCVDDLRGRGP